MQYHHAPDRYLTAIRAALPLYDELPGVRSCGRRPVSRSGGCLISVSGRRDLRAVSGGASRSNSPRTRRERGHACVGPFGPRRSHRSSVGAPAGILSRRVQFDVVVSALAVHHLDGSGKADLFRRIGERLAPGGRLVMADVVLPDSEPGPATPIDPTVDRPGPPRRSADMAEGIRLRGAGALETKRSRCHRRRPSLLHRARVTRSARLAPATPFQADPDDDGDGVHAVPRDQKPMTAGTSAAGTTRPHRCDWAILAHAREPPISSSGTAQAPAREGPQCRGSGFRLGLDARLAG